MESRPHIGVFTQTIIRSPVIKVVLHGRIRSDQYNDVIFVGSDFINVKQVEHGGLLKHIATKSDFGVQIRTARIFSVRSDALEDDFLVKTEIGSTRDGGQSIPPQFLVVTLDSDDLLFLYLAEDPDGELRWIHQTFAMPTYDNILNQTGVHLAVDPFSRAVAVGAHEQDVVIYSAKTKHQIRDELQQGSPQWCPVARHRLIKVDGVILHMEFLIPPNADQDHIVLLVIVADDRKTKAVWIDWFFSSGLQHAQCHPNQPLDSLKSASNMLIPLKEAAFLLVNGSDLRLYRDLLSGSANCIHLSSFEPKTPYPGCSPRAPLWVSWCRPRRNRAAQREQDILYLIREDGMVYLVHISSGQTRLYWSLAGNAECHVGAAFASLGDARDPDILAIVGDMSNGKVMKIGAWATAGRIEDQTREDAMEMQMIQSLPNWASATDMLVSSLPHAHGRSARSRDSVFITSGRQPYGTITELRLGLEARISTYFEFDDLRSVTSAWVLPNRSTGSVLILMSTPSFTRLLDLDDGVDEYEREGLKSLELCKRTLAADILSNGYLIQITNCSICVAASLDAGFEDRSRWDTESKTTIVLAAVEPLPAIAVIITRTDSTFEIQAFKHRVEQGTAMPDGEEEGLQAGVALSLCEEPIGLATVLVKHGLLVVVATASGMLELYTVDPSNSTVISRHGSLHKLADQHSLCDSIALLHSKFAHGSTEPRLGAVCGLRDGRMLAVEINYTTEPKFGQVTEISFGRSTVRLTRHSSDPHQAYAMSGRETCTVTWDGQATDLLTIQNLWVSDKARPEMAQDAIMAVSKMPSAEYLGDDDLADALVLISAGEIWVASVLSIPATVPRQIKVSGTPTRLTYCQQQRSLVSASICYGVRSFPSEMPHGKPEERRQIWPAIDFIPSDGTTPSFTFDYQPGDRIFALAEWSFNHNGKVYSFLLVAGSYVSRSGSTKGRVSILQPSIKDWEVYDVREGRNYTFEKPVYSLALYDELTYVACIGDRIVASRYSPDERKWQEICTPFRLPSVGVRISVSGSLVHVSTHKDSLVILKLISCTNLDDTDLQYKLVAFASAPCLAPLTGHTILTDTSVGAGEVGDRLEIAMMSTKDGRVLGTTSPIEADSDTSSRVSRPRMLFEAQLPCSLTCLRQGSTIPSWHSSPPSGVLTNGILGVAADGSLIRVSVLEEGLWRRLFWLQRICEWSSRFSPHLLEAPNYAVEDVSFEGRERGFPIGLSADSQDEIALFATTDCEGTYGDMHTDGDVLKRLLDKGGLNALRDAIREMAQRDDRIGDWLKDHLDEELDAAQGIIAELRTLIETSL